MWCNHPSNTGQHLCKSQNTTFHDTQTIPIAKHTRSYPGPNTTLRFFVCSEWFTFVSKFFINFNSRVLVIDLRKPSPGDALRPGEAMLKMRNPCRFSSPGIGPISGRLCCNLVLLTSMIQRQFTFHTSSDRSVGQPSRPVAWHEARSITILCNVRRSKGTASSNQGQGFLAFLCRAG